MQDEELGRWNLGGTGEPSFVSSRPGFHPGTRVKVETRVVAGKLPRSAPVDRRSGKHRVVLSEVSLLARARKLGYWPFRLCFEEASRRGGQPKGGETVLRLGVGSAGQVTSVRLVRSKLDDPAIADCLAERSRGLALLPPPRPIAVEMSIQLWPGDVPVPLLPPAPADDATLDAQQLERDVAAAEAEFAACYGLGLERDRELWGRVQLHVALGPDGRVRSAKQAESHFPDAAVATCVLRTLRALQLKPTKNTAQSFELGLRFGALPTSTASITP